MSLSRAEIFLGAPLDQTPNFAVCDVIAVHAAETRKDAFGRMSVAQEQRQKPFHLIVAIALTGRRREFGLHPGMDGRRRHDAPPRTM